MVIMEIEISYVNKINGTFGIILRLTLIFILILVSLFLITNIILLFIILSLFIGTFLFTYRIRNNRLYYLSGFGHLVPIFKESAIRITDKYITVKIREKPAFFIWWKDFDIIKINKKPKKWKIIQKLTAKSYKIQFHSIYPNYSQNFKYISSFELNTKHFSIQKCNEIIKNLRIFSNNLNKKLINEI